MHDQIPVDVIIMYPDGDGKATDPGVGREFHLELLALQQNALIVPVLNGKDSSKLTELSQKVHASNRRVLPICSFEAGLLNALVVGYKHVLDIIRLRRLESVSVVRLDTAEHNPAVIGALIARAMQVNGLVIGDLDFTDTSFLVLGTPDYFAHTREWPRMTSAATGGKIWLSCAHGYLAFGPNVLGRAFEGLCQLKSMLERSGEPPQWGLDLGMILAAIGERVSVERLPVLATVLRNRPAEKIELQRTAARRWIDAAYHIYPELGS